MDARNLAIMFGPSLVRPNADSMVAMVRDMSDQCRVVESIIQHVRDFSRLYLTNCIVTDGFVAWAASVAPSREVYKTVSTDVARSLGHVLRWC